MELTHTFTVPAPLDTVWAALLDPELVAPCLPGATLTESGDSAFAGTVKVKLGPISLLYKGSGEFTQQDDVERRLTIKAAGKDTRGNGTAAATVTVVLTATTATTTVGAVTTDLTITGKPAQLGRGLIAEVGARILATFADNLAATLATPREATAEVGPPTPTEPAPEEPGESGPVRGRAEPPDESTVEPLDLVRYGGAPAAKRLLPVIIGVVVAILVLLWRRRR